MPPSPTIRQSKYQISPLSYSQILRNIYEVLAIIKWFDHHCGELLYTLLCSSSLFHCRWYFSIKCCRSVLVFRIDSILLIVVCFRFQVQAVNAIGSGPLSAVSKVKTRSLPPPPPCLECVSISFNQLKLKWRHSVNTAESVHFILEMRQNDGRSVFWRAKR